MRALAQAQTEKLRGTPAQQQVGARMAVQVSSVGRTLAEGDFERACAKYAGIAREFGVDLDAYKAKLAPIAGSPEGGCDTLAAGRRVNEAYSRFNSSVDTSGMTALEQHALNQRFTQSLDEATKYVQTEPARACAIVDDVLKQFGVQ